VRRRQSHVQHVYRFGRHTAASIVDRISVNQAQWTDFFQPNDFFNKYRYYLQICVSAGSSDTQIKWCVAFR
jgi:poly(A) polymerase Pap1